jgi:hypothetical protein
VLGAPVHLRRQKPVYRLGGAKKGVDIIEFNVVSKLDLQLVWYRNKASGTVSISLAINSWPPNTVKHTYLLGPAFQFHEWSTTSMLYL